LRETLWVFGYGSLIWDPGFPVADRRIARADGLAPQLLHAVDPPPRHGRRPRSGAGAGPRRGASCDGVAFAVAPGAEAATLAALRERELISSAYLETTLPLETAEGPLTALAYVIDPDHAQYCGGLALEDQAQIIARATGGRGRNRDYLWSTAAHLADLGIADPDLEWLAARVRQLTAEGPA
jgi:cation transport protein ChaC